MTSSILLTGGLGYIGSHIATINTNHDIIIVDNLSNSTSDVYINILKLTNNKIHLYIGDVNDDDLMDKIFSEHNIIAIIHLAGLKSVLESIHDSWKYYYQNINLTLQILKYVDKYKPKKFIFSSSATVYGINHYPVTENSTTILNNISNPYGKTKYISEEIIRDFSINHPSIEFIILRYFNPISSHPSGFLTENPLECNNIFPALIKAIKNNQTFKIFGSDYDTRDGTCERDYIHVLDLAEVHMLFVNHDLVNGSHIYNVGTNSSVSILELISMIEKMNDLKIDYIFSERRVNDIPIVFTKIDKLINDFNWQPKYSLEDMCKNI